MKPYLLRALAASIVVATFSCVACAPEHGTITRKGFVYKSRKYRVDFTVPSKRQFINANWTVDNYVYDKTGPFGGTWSAKEGKRFLGHRMVDKDGDGTASREQAFLFDLRLVHRRTNGVIWMQTFELPSNQQDKKLEVFLRNYVDSLSGTGLYRQGSVYGVIRATLRRFAAKVDLKMRTTRGPSQVLHAIISLVDLARKKISPKYEADKIKLLLSKIRRLGRPNLLLLVGYHNQAADFVGSLQDFGIFVKRIQVTR